MLKMDRTEVLIGKLIAIGHGIPQRFENPRNHEEPESWFLAGECPEGNVIVDEDRPVVCNHFFILAHVFYPTPVAFPERVKKFNQKLFLLVLDLDVLVWRMQCGHGDLL